MRGPGSEATQRMIEALAGEGPCEPEALSALERGADANARLRNGKPALSAAVEAQALGLVAALLSHGANPNAVDRLERSALHEAARVDCEAAARALISAGANASASARAGLTPLHVCASEWSPGAASALLEAGASLEARDKYEWTPLHRAVYFGRPKMVRWLLEAGADASAVTRSGKTAMSMAHEARQACREGKRLIHPRRAVSCVEELCAFEDEREQRLRALASARAKP